MCTQSTLHTMLQQFRRSQFWFIKKCLDGLVFWLQYKNDLLMVSAYCLGFISFCLIVSLMHVKCKQMTLQLLFIVHHKKTKRLSNVVYISSSSVQLKKHYIIMVMKKTRLITIKKQSLNLLKKLINLHYKFLIKT